MREGMGNRGEGSGGDGSDMLPEEGSRLLGDSEEDGGRFPGGGHVPGGHTAQEDATHVTKSRGNKET